MAEEGVKTETGRTTERLSSEVSTLKKLAIFFHDEIISQTGGLPGLWNEDKLESALAAPFSTFEGEDLHPTVFGKAAALLRSLIKNHPFVDGNKRTGFIMTALFLLERGWGFKKNLPDNEIVEFCVLVAEEDLPLPEISLWLEKSTTQSSVDDFLRVNRPLYKKLANA